MGFNKRFVSKEIIDNVFKNKTSLEEIFRADAFIIMDEYSSKVFELFKRGMTDDEIKTTIYGHRQEN